MKRFWIILPILALLIGMLPISALAADPVELSFGVVVKGVVESKVEVRADAGNKDNDNSDPMPEGSVDGVYTIEGYTNGEQRDVKISFTLPGEYKYTVTQIKDEGAGGTYDERVFTVTAVVTLENGQLGLAAAITAAGDATKHEVIEFINSDPIIPPPPVFPEPVLYNLTVTEEIYGDAPRTDTFDFTLEFSNEDVELPASFEVTGSRYPNGGSLRFSAVRPDEDNAAGGGSGASSISATFTLGHEENIVIKGLPDGTKINIIQTGGDERYETKIDGTLEPSRAAERAVKSADVRIDYANGYTSSEPGPGPDPGPDPGPEPDPPAPVLYNLTVTEELFGRALEEMDKNIFTFTVEFSHPDKEIPATYKVEGSRFTNGGAITFAPVSDGGSSEAGSGSGTPTIRATFTLGHLQKIIIKGLPDGTQIKLVQSGGDRRVETRIDGVRDHTRTAVRAIAGADMRVDYMNGYYFPGDEEYDEYEPDIPLLPPTGLTWWPIPVLVLVGGGLIFVALKSRKKTEK